MLLKAFLFDSRKDASHKLRTKISVENRYCARAHKVISSGKQVYTKHKAQSTEQEIPVNKIDPGDVDICQTVCGCDGSFSDLVSFQICDIVYIISHICDKM